MIKVISGLLSQKKILFVRTAVMFCTKKVEQKSAEITKNFTDKTTEQTKQKPITNGRAWKAAELRLKSTEDLHKLWFVCVRQKNLVLADELAMEHDPSYIRKGGKIRRIQKLQLTMRRILFIINQRQAIKKQYRKQLQEQYIAKKQLQLQTAVQQAPEQLPQITFEMLRAKYQALRRGIDNINYLEKIFNKKEQVEERYKRADARVTQLDPQKQFESFWSYQTTIGQRPTQMQILKSHIKNWKSLNLRQRKIILGFLNARRSKDAKQEFKKQLRILGQKIAFEEVKARADQSAAKN